MRLILAIASILIFSLSAHAAVFPLEITNIKASGTGSPAIPSTNRIFRAYTGVEYNIRAAVIGGLYPYTYSLSGQPAGMTIDRKTGEISWPNPQSNSGTITLSVTDSESTTVTATWAITVGTSTSDFIFVDASYSGTETGSISQPYSSLANMLSGETDNNKIVYFRAGTYQMVDYNSTGDYVMNLEASPRTWIAYPGETVTLQGGSANSSQAHRIVSFSPFYFDGLTIKDTNGYAILTYGSANYITIRNCVFDGLVPTDAANENYGFIFTSNNGDGYYYVVQDNEFKNWRNASAIGSMYYNVKALIENNYIHSPSANGSGAITTQGISPKYGTDTLTIRGNKVAMNYGSLMGDHNGTFSGATDIEICFNLFVMASGRGGHKFDAYYDGSQGDTYYWRNTLIADIAIVDVSGPYTINNNVISHPNNTIGFDDWSGDCQVSNFIYYDGRTTFGNYITVANNLTDTTASNLVDSADDYKLIEAQEAYIGTRGWQLADGTTPMEDAAVLAVLTGGGVVGGVIVH